MTVTGLNRSDFCTIADFCKRHLVALSDLFVQVLRLCRAAGLVQFAHVAVDGTKVKANASRHKAMSYGRMKTAEPALAAEVDTWLEQAREVDAAEDAAARRQRRHCARRSTPRLAIIDTQSVKCIGVRGPRGYNGAKKLVGRKRVALVDAEGHVLALAIIPGNVQDRDTLPALDDGKEAWPSPRLAIFDGAFTAKRCQEWCNVHGMRHRGVEKQLDQKGFVVLERHWVVERTFRWLRHWAGLQRERAGRLDVSAGRLACAASLMAANALNNSA